jgi:hypothetical protein
MPVLRLCVYSLKCVLQTLANTSFEKKEPIFSTAIISPDVVLHFNKQKKSAKKLI